MELLDYIVQTPTNAFIQSVNLEIGAINALIQEYNDPDSTNKLEILYEIDTYNKYLAAKYPANKMLACPEFEVFQNNLLKQLKNAFKTQGVRFLEHSISAKNDLSRINQDQETLKQWDELLKQKNSLFTNPKSEDEVFIKNLISNLVDENNPQKLNGQLIELKYQLRIYSAQMLFNPKEKEPIRNLIRVINTKINTLESSLVTKKKPTIFAALIANMSPEETNEFASRLEHFALYLDEHAPALSMTKVIEGMYSKKSEQYQILSEYSFENLGGFNSLNFKITHNTTQQAQVIKLENRINNPKDLANRLELNALREHTTNTSVDKLAFYQNGDKNPVIKKIVINEFCLGSSLESKAKKVLKNQSEKINLALDYFKQMAAIMMIMQEEQVAFADAKNGNWLLDEFGKLKISDTKSLIRAKNNQINLEKNWEQGYGFVLSATHIPPEYPGSHLMDAEKLHSYLLGKNLYQFLTCAPQVMLIKNKDGASFNFSAELFKTAEGLKLKELILNLTDADPAKRISLKEVISNLAGVKEPYKGTFFAENKEEASSFKDTQSKSQSTPHSPN
ncbi:MAG: hypothetical protein WC627_05480 [Legionella sp.]|jgi:hypothetical protein